MARAQVREARTSHSVVNRAHVAGIAMLIAACAAPLQRPELLGVRLIDSVPWSDEFGSGVLRRVAIVYSDHVDTLTGILTETSPVLQGDSVLFGVSSNGGEVGKGFRYALRERALTAVDLPADLSWEHPALSTTADRLAYWSTPGNGRAAFVVCDWPGGTELYRSDPIAVPATDALITHVAWVDSVTVQWVVEIPDGRALRGTWSRESGFVVRDTIRIELP